MIKSQSSRRHSDTTRESPGVGVSKLMFSEPLFPHFSELSKHLNDMTFIYARSYCISAVQKDGKYEREYERDLKDLTDGVAILVSCHIDMSLYPI